MKKILKERYKELKEFSLEVKRLVRSVGRSMKVDLSDLEELFVKYNINLEDVEDELKRLEASDS